MNREKSIFRSYAPRLFEIARQIRWLYCLSFCIGQYRFVKTRQWVMNGITNMCPSKFFINSQDNKVFTIYWIIAFSPNSTPTTKSNAKYLKRYPIFHKHLTPIIQFIFYQLSEIYISIIYILLHSSRYHLILL